VSSFNSCPIISLQAIIWYSWAWAAFSRKQSNHIWGIIVCSSFNPSLLVSQNYVFFVNCFLCQCWDSLWYLELRCYLLVHFHAVIEQFTNNFFRIKTAFGRNEIKLESCWKYENSSFRILENTKMLAFFIKLKVTQMTLIVSFFH